MKEVIVLGLTGSLAAGKGVVSDFFKDKGFTYYSLSNELRELAKSFDIEITRENLQNLGNKYRDERGNSFLAELVAEKIRKNNFNSIVDGIRNPGEVEYLRLNLYNFILISVDAPNDIRFERMIQRNRESDPKIWEDFIKVDNRDKGIGESESGQGVGKCMSMADFNLMNDSSLENASYRVQELYDLIF